MSKPESRRVNPIGHIALIAVLGLLVFQLFAIVGVLELKAGTVAKYAPWAYEPFLRLVGEHPESQPRWASVEQVDELPATSPDIVELTGLEASAIPVLIETNAAALSTNTILEATIPREVEADPVPVIAPTNTPVEERLDVPPVG
jgi:hypothetical protein